MKGFLAKYLHTMITCLGFTLNYGVKRCALFHDFWYISSKSIQQWLVQKPWYIKEYLANITNYDI